MNDTIAAIATASGIGGVGIIRVSGPDALAVCKSITGITPKPRYAQFSDFRNHKAELIDSGLVLYFPAPNSFTGENVVELQGHGGPVVMDLLLAAVLRCTNVRMARAGEFSERAFVNNKIDLVQAEAIADLINATSEQAVMAANRSLQGDFSHSIELMLAELRQLRSYVEAAIDFPDEDIELLQKAEIAERIRQLGANINRVYNSAKQGSVLQEGLDVAIVGKPNVGKSTLMNTLSREDLAIVTPVAGTTRDVISKQVTIGNLLLKLHDTAGMHATTDLVEQHGIERSAKQLSKAQIILYLIDAVDNIDWPLLAARSDDAKVVVLRNKIDLHALEPAAVRHQDYTEICISASTGQGLDLLESELQHITGAAGSSDGSVYMARRRHLHAIDSARVHIDRALECLTTHELELVAEELRLCSVALFVITGKLVADDLLADIFSEFCIGK